MIKRPFKGFILTSFVLLSLLGLFGSSIFVLFETQKGQNFLLRQGLSYLEKKGILLNLEGFEGDFPKNFTIQKITLYETPEIPLAVIENLKINFKWQNIFKGVLTFKTLTAKKVDLSGLSSEKTPSSFSTSDIISFLRIGAIPELPLSLALKNFDIQDLVLPGTTEMGEPEKIHLHLRGFLKLPHFSSLTKDTAFIKIDGLDLPFHALLSVNFDTHSKEFKSTLEIEDGTQGLFKSEEPLSLYANFEKQLKSPLIQGDFIFSNPSVSSLKSDFTLKLNEIPELSFKGDAEIPTLLKDISLPLSPIFNFEGALFFKETELISDLTITHQDFKLSAQGTYPLNQDGLTLTGTIEILNLDWLNSPKHSEFLNLFYPDFPMTISFNIMEDLNKIFLLTLESQGDQVPFSFKATSSINISEETSHGDLEISFPIDQEILKISTHFIWENPKFYLNDLSLKAPGIDLYGNLYWIQSSIPHGEISFTANHLEHLNSNLPEGNFKGKINAGHGMDLQAEIMGDTVHWQDFKMDQIHFKANAQNYEGKGLFLSLITTNLTGLNIPSVTLKGEAKGDLDSHNPLKGDLSFSTPDTQWVLNIMFETYLKDHTTFFTIQPFKTKIHTESLSLVKPLKFIISEDSVICPETRFQMGKSILDASFEKKHTLLNGHIHLQNFSLELLKILNPSFAFPFLMSGEADLNGTIFDPSLVLKASITPETHKTFFEEPLHHFQGNFDGNWNGRLLKANFILKSEASHLLLTADLPIVLEDGKHLIFKDTAPLKVLAKGSGDLETLAYFLINEGDLLKGEIALSLLLEGSLKERHLSGYIKINKGFYQSFQLGTVLENITFNAQGQGKRFQILEGSAQDGSKGSFQISGFFSETITENGPESYNLQMHFDNFRAVSLDLITANATGDLQFLKTFQIHEPSLAGNLILTPVSIHIPKKFPTNIPVLPVKRIGGLKEVEDQALKDKMLFLHTLKEETRQKLSIIELYPSPSDESSTISLLPPIPLKIHLTIPSKFSVDGWGLSSFWQGDMDVDGNLDTPLLNGTLFLVSGDYSLFGKTFSLLKGSLSFTGTSEIDPLVNVVAQISTADIVAQILIDGRLTTPEFTLQSQPTLPPGEIVSRILFGKGIGSLTPFQSLQIASALGDLTGTTGPLGFVDEIRNSLGLGALSFTSGASSGGPGLNLGRFLSNDVSLNVTPNLTTNSAQASVEVKVFPHVTIQSDLDTQSAAGGGVNWQWDYD